MIRLMRTNVLLSLSPTYPIQDVNHAEMLLNNLLKSRFEADAFVWQISFRNAQT
jgi:hypothetical protein